MAEREKLSMYEAVNRLCNVTCDRIDSLDCLVTGDHNNRTSERPTNQGVLYMIATRESRELPADVRIGFRRNDNVGMQVTKLPNEGIEEDPLFEVRLCTLNNNRVIEEEHTLCIDNDRGEIISDIEGTGNPYDPRCGDPVLFEGWKIRRALVDGVFMELHRQITREEKLRDAMAEMGEMTTEERVRRMFGILKGDGAKTAGSAPSDTYTI